MMTVSMRSGGVGDRRQSLKQNLGPFNGDGAGWMRGAGKMLILYHRGDGVKLVVAPERIMVGKKK